MTETPRDSISTPDSAPDDWEAPSDLPLEDVEEVFVNLAKALRAHQLYDSRNPVYQRFLAALSEALARLWPSRDELQVLVEEERFIWMGEEVYKNDDRSESLAFLFYRDGIRDLTFRKGFQERELGLFLDALHRARRAGREGDDLVTILWDLDLQLLDYTALDPGVEGTMLPGEGEPSAIDFGSVLVEELGEVLDAPANTPELPSADEDPDGEPQSRSGGAGPPPEVVRKEDFNPTLYALDPDERRFLSEELSLEMQRDLRSAVLDALFDRLEEPGHADRQVEILSILRTLLPNLLSRGRLRPAARIVHEVRAIRDRTGSLSDEAGLLVEGLLEELSGPEVVRELVRALEDGSVPPDRDLFEDLLMQLRPTALASLLRASESTEKEGVRSLLLTSIARLVEDNRDRLVELLDSDDPQVVAGAVRVAGRLRFTEASGSLTRLLDSGSAEVRAAVVEASTELPSSALAGGLQRTLGDANRELRIAAARALGRLRYKPAARGLREVLESKEFRHADVTEKVAFFEAYGQLAGADAVGFLDRTLNGRGFLGRRDPSELRAGAALALGKIDDAEARASLERAGDDEDPIVRSAVGRALKEEGGPRNG